MSAWMSGERPPVSRIRKGWPVAQAAQALDAPRQAEAAPAAPHKVAASELFRHKGARQRGEAMVLRGGAHWLEQRLLQLADWLVRGAVALRAREQARLHRRAAQELARAQARLARQQAQASAPTEPVPAPAAAEEAEGMTFERQRIGGRMLGAFYVGGELMCRLPDVDRH